MGCLFRESADYIHHINFCLIKSICCNDTNSPIYIGEVFYRFCDSEINHSSM